MKKIIVLIALAVSLAAIIWVASSNRVQDTAADLVYTPGEPLEMTLELASEWREIRATSTVSESALSEFLARDIFAPTLREALLAKSVDTAREPLLDVIVCQANIPPRLVGRLILETSTEAQVMVLARGSEERSPYQSIVTLAGNGEGAWVITDISCAQGEVAPEVEFTFDREGYLLKSVPPPYESGSWYVVFEQNGQMGYVAPLTFSAESVCVDESGTESVCEPDSLKEPLSVLVQGDMTESGVDVKRITFN